MLNLSKSAASFAGCLLAACFMCVAPAAAQDTERTAPLSPAEMLEDGLDAFTDKAPGAARNLLEELIETYPQSPEASKARKALGKLEGPPESAYEKAVIREDEAERLKGFRRAFLMDAGDRVFFSENSASVGGRARVIIESQARWLKARPSLKVDVIGRADDGGSRQAEQDLARQRAEATRDKLIASGIDGGRLRIRALGSSDPLAVCPTPLCKAENRNVELYISAFGDAGDGGEPEAPRIPGKGADVGDAQAGLSEVTSR